MRESVKTQDSLKIKDVFAGSSREAFPRSEVCAQHMTGMRRVMIDGDSWFSECLAGKSFPRDTNETFYFANLSYPIHLVSTHTIYTHITHILKGVLFRKKTIAITLESGRLSYPQFSTQSIVVFLNSYLSISKSLRGW